MAQTLQSVSHALRALQELRTRETAGVTELAATLGVGASTMHRLLATLQEHGFVEQTSGRRYRLGPSMTLSPDAASVEHCIEVGYPIMESLRDASSETVHISTLDGTRVKFVAAIESPHVMRVTSRVGRSIPAHTSAAGKVLLAALDPQKVRELYPHEHLPAETDATTVSRAALEAELDRVRADGYGRNYGESERGLAALAVPIRRPSGRPLCSLTLTGPIARFDPDGTGGPSQRELELRDLLVDHAAALERRLAY